MQYAVIATGGKQYIATPGESLIIESLDKQVGDSVTFEEILLTVDGEKVAIGEPLVAGLNVTGTVVEQRLGEKLRVFKYRPKSRYSRTMGHRQHQTVVRIDAIGDKKAPKSAKQSDKAAASSLSLAESTAKAKSASKAKDKE